MVRQFYKGLNISRVFKLLQVFIVQKFKCLEKMDKDLKKNVIRSWKSTNIERKD